MDWSDEKYFEAKEYWRNILAQLAPRNESPEEVDAFLNAMDDRMAECEL